MNTLFRNILTASFHGSIVILAVMLLRLVLKKTPRKYICLLWLLAGLRLLMPFQIQSDLSLQPSADPVAQVQQQISRSQTPAAPEDFSPADLDVPAPVQTPEALPDIQTPVTTVISSTPSHTPETAPEPDTGFDFLSVLPWFWLGIACCFGIYSLYTYLTLKLKVREAVKIPGGWECDRIETAFILGFIRPNIYIPMGMTPEEQRYILAHERTHLDKGDHWFKMVGVSGAGTALVQSAGVGSLHPAVQGHRDRLRRAGGAVHGAGGAESLLRRPAELLHQSGALRGLSRGLRRGERQGAHQVGAFL